MAYRLVIEENTIYEIDEECTACEQKQNGNVQNRNQNDAVMGNDSFENRKAINGKRDAKYR